jgi:hypothetical protein
MESPLVRFEHALAPAAPWAAAGHDITLFGAALDRVFGDAGDLHLLQHFATADDILLGDDPLVLLANLIDGFGPSMGDPPPTVLPELAAMYDFGGDGAYLHDLWVYDTHT